VFMAFGFSGYLLPWNELAFFATRVGTAIVGVVPVVGHQFLLLARGGEEVTGDTLARFYSLHVVVLPMLVFFLLGIHLFLVQKHGMSAPEREEGKRLMEAELPSMPFVPHFLLRDMMGWYLALALLAALAALFPWELGEKADPFASAPEGISPEWYYLFMFQTLKLLPERIGPFEGEVIGVLFFAGCGLVVLITPFLDRGRKSRLTLNVLVSVAVVYFIAMTAWGWFSRADEAAYRVGLGAFLFVIVLSLLIPSTSPRTGARRTIYASLALAVLVTIIATFWEVLT